MKKPSRKRFLSAFCVATVPYTSVDVCPTFHRCVLSRRVHRNQDKRIAPGPGYPRKPFSLYDMSSKSCPISISAKNKSRVCTLISASLIVGGRQGPDATTVPIVLCDMQLRASRTLRARSGLPIQLAVLKVVRYSHASVIGNRRRQFQTSKTSDSAENSTRLFSNILFCGCNCKRSKQSTDVYCTGTIVNVQRIQASKALSHHSR